jgi:hypothetical protein
MMPSPFRTFKSAVATVISLWMAVLACLMGCTVPSLVNSAPPKVATTNDSSLLNAAPLPANRTSWPEWRIARIIQPATRPRITTTASPFVVVPCPAVPWKLPSPQNRTQRRCKFLPRAPSFCNPISAWRRFAFTMQWNLFRPSGTAAETHSSQPNCFASRNHLASFAYSLTPMASPSVGKNPI